MTEQILNILIVEDEEAHAELMRRAFVAHAPHAERFDLAVASSLKEAQAYLVNGNPPDLIIADLLLPDGKGTELLPAEDQGPSLPIVLMTSYGNEQIAVEAIKAGALDYVVKSVTTLNDMPHVAERALRQWRHITERIRAEKALKASEERYRTLFEDVPVGLYRTTPLGQILDANAAFVEMLGYPDRKTLMSANSADLYLNSEARQEWQTLMQRDGVVRDFETRMRRYDGTVIWVANNSRAVWDGDNQVLYYKGSLENITERKRAEKEIRRRAAHLEALNAIIATAAAAPSLLQLLKITLDRTLSALSLEQGVIWVADQTAAKNLPPETATIANQITKVTGLDKPNSIVVDDWQQAVTDESIPATKPLMSRFGIRAFIIVPILAEGQRVGGLCVAAPELRRWTSEEVALVEAVGRQLGATAERLRLLQEVRRHADELAEAVARLQELDRLKSEFIQNASHELRTPLALIRGYAEMLNSGELGELQPQQQKPLSIITRRAQMLSDMVQDITLILEVETNPPRPETVQIDQLARAAIEDFQMVLEQAGLTLKAEIAPQLPALKGSPTHLRRVLDNLLSNAIKFTPEGGTVTLCVWVEGKEMIIQVSDTGIGIPAEQLERIFERFYQIDGSARRRYGGMGLGLALVQEIVQSHQGSVMVKSQIDQGSTFTVKLPLQ